MYYVTTIAGTQHDYTGEEWHEHRDGSAMESFFAGPTGIAMDSKGNLYVSDYGSNTIRKISNNLSGS